ncbi:hypothetical protein B0J14DRAFT_573007 [Halenospora varia]|nr:hypothetical protein B0J14DRAFT_573007 [Halenospora varia]
MLGSLSLILPTYAMSLWFIPMKIWQATAFTILSSGVCLAEGWLPGLGHAAHLGGTLFGMSGYVMIVLLSLRGRKALPKMNARR